VNYTLKMEVECASETSVNTTQFCNAEDQNFVFGVSALVPGKRTDYTSSRKNPVTEVFVASSPDQEYIDEERSSPTPNNDVHSYISPGTESRQPSKVFLPPSLDSGLYSETVTPSPAEYIRTYFGG
jgi:hypothetical protein